jgi:DoxX-like family
MATLSIAQPAQVSNVKIRAGYTLSGLVTLFLLFDVAIKFINPPGVADALAHVGWTTSLAVDLGVILLICTSLYAIPRTSILGAVLLTGYLGAVATHLRVGDPLFSHVLFPVYLGGMLWAGLFLRDERVRTLLPF